MEELNSLTLIESVNLNAMSNTLQKINQFQRMCHSQLKEKFDYGIIPGTGKKPTLLKPGAEKIVMMMGLATEFQIIESTRDFENGFFEYVIKCSLKKNGLTVTEGLGSCNSMERKYKTQDSYSVDNTLLKMAKKRAMVDAVLLVASLSDVFTQDMEDSTDLNDNDLETSNQKVYTDRSGNISDAQAKRMFAIAKGNSALVIDVLKKCGYNSSGEVSKADYESICKIIEKKMEEPNDE